MAMTKKEKQDMEDLRQQLAISRAFRFTEKVERDVPPPQGFGELSKGWEYNAYSKRIDVACSSSIHHAIGTTEKTNTQNPRNLYSSKLLALKALRYELEQKFARELAEIDEKIASEAEGHQLG